MSIIADEEYFFKQATKRFWKHTDKRSDDECWLWRGPTVANNKGNIPRGDIRMFGKHVKAHRFSYMIHNGEIPEGMIVLHSCDNSLCMNPKHLRLGTHEENMEDMTKKNRQSKGEHRPLSKLTEDQVRAIRADTRNQYVIAAEYQITQGLVSAIKRRIRWKHII